MFHQGIRLGRIRIENTKTSKEALALEKTYFPKIKKIFRQIVKEYADGSKFHFLYEAERRYGEEIRTIIKSLVTQTYLLGMDYIARATNKPYYISISQNDVTQILIRSDEAYRMFWRLVTKYLQVKRNRNTTTKATKATTAVGHIGQVISRMDPNKLSTDVLLTDEMFQVSDWEDDRLLDEDTNAQLIINGIVTTTLALSTLQKYNEFKKEQKIIFEEGRQQELLLEETLLTLTDEEGEIAAGGADTFIFATENDAKVCDICASLEGMEWDVDDPSIVIPRDDTHPNCILPDTLIDSPSGVTTVLRTFYNGPVIEFGFAKSGNITVTPNHMFLTPNGFAAADFLHEGDYIINRSFLQGESSSIYPNNDNKPARIDDIFNSFRVSFGMKSGRMPTSSEYLHGDSRFSNGNIDIIRPYCFLGNDISNISSLKHIHTHSFNSGNSGLSIQFNRSSTFATMLKGLAFASDSSMGLFRESNPFFSRRLRHTQKHGFAPISRSNSNTLQSSRNSIPTNVKYLSDCLNRFPRIIETDKIVDVNINRMYSGFVYDLETPSTTYIGNSHILSNCRCRLLLKIGNKIKAK